MSPANHLIRKRNENERIDKEIMAITSTAAAAYVASLSAPDRLVSLKPVGTFVKHWVQQFPFVRKYTSISRAVLNPNEIATEIKERNFDLPSPGCSRIRVELSKPLGIVLEEDKGGNIFVAKLVRDGNADKSGLVDFGDQLIATSAIVYGGEEDYQGVRVRKGMQIVQLNVQGERFETEGEHIARRGFGSQTVPTADKGMAEALALIKGVVCRWRVLFGFGLDFLCGSLKPPPTFSSLPLSLHLRIPPELLPLAFSFLPLPLPTHFVPYPFSFLSFVLQPRLCSIVFPFLVHVTSSHGLVFAFPFSPGSPDCHTCSSSDNGRGHGGDILQGFEHTINGS